MSRAVQMPNLSVLHGSFFVIGSILVLQFMFLVNCVCRGGDI